MADSELMVRLALAVANDDSHGYSQVRRWPSQGTDFDCSSLMYWAANQAGYNVPLAGYTGTELSDFQRAGFTAIPYSQVGAGALKRGDVLLAHNNSRQHTELYIGNGQTVGAHIAETGGVDGKPGDQTGNEISVAGLWGNWDWVLRPPSSGSGAAAVPASLPKPKMRVFRQGKWRAWKSVPCTRGLSKVPIYDFQAKNLGPNGWFQLTLEGGEVLPRNKCNTAHKKKVIGITLYYDTPNPAETGYYAIEYRVKTANGWLKWERDDNDGGAGDDVNAVCRIQARLVRL